MLEASMSVPRRELEVGFNPRPGVGDLASVAAPGTEHQG